MLSVMPPIDVRDLGRLSTITAVLARHGFGGLVQAAGLSATPSGPAASAAAPWAIRARDALVELGPTFVKLGQVLSVRPDITPAALIEELRGLQDHVPEAPWEGVKAVLEEALGGPLEATFSEFDERPVASASIAQVHLATLRLPDGGERQVAVKVQRPGMERVIRSDLHILHTLAGLLEGRVELPGLYTPQAIVTALERAVLDELDFTLEARNAARFRLALARSPEAYVPEILLPWCSRRVLVMERVDGEPLSALGPDDPRAKDLARLIVDLSVRQVFDEGFFHGDPHPGNLLVLRDGRLCWLDFGLCGSLTAEMQDTLVTLLAAMVFEDAETLALTLHRAGGAQGRLDLRAFKGDIERLMTRYKGASYARLSERGSLLDLVELTSRYRLSLVPEYTLLARAVSLLDGVLRGLAPNEDPVTLIRPHAARRLSDRLSPDRLRADALRALLQAQGGLKSLPLQVSQLLMDLERGAIRIEARDPDAQRLADALGSAAFRLSLALCASALLIAGAILLTAPAAPVWGLPLAAIFGGALVLAAATMWSGLVAHTLLGDRLSLAGLRRRALGVLRFFVGRR